MRGRRFALRLLSKALLVTLAAMTLQASGRADTTLPTHPNYDEIMERGSLNVAVYRDFPPFSYRENGKLKGVDVDLANIMAERMGVHAAINELTADEDVSGDLRNAIWKGQVLGGGVINDVMLHVPTDRAFALKNNMVTIFGPYFDETLIMARNLELTGETPTLAVYRYEKVGVELDSLADFYLLGFQGGILSNNIVHYPTIAAAVDALNDNSVAAVYGLRSQIESALADNPKGFDVGTVFAPNVTTDRWPLGLAVSANTRQLGYALDDIMREMVQDGTVQKVFETHGLTYTIPGRYAE